MRFTSLFAAVFLALTLSLSCAWAQATPVKIDYDAWESVAKRAEASIESGLASNAAFENLRAEIVVWRDRFLIGQDENSARVETLKAQVKALGPPPAEGETEAEEIAARRKDLNERLAAANTPIKTAEEAFSRADGLAREIDAIIRERRADALLRLAPTPLNPANWSAAIGDFLGSVRGIRTETLESWSSQIKVDALRDELPRTLLYVALALLLLLRRKAIMLRIRETIMARVSKSAGAIVSFVISLGQIVVPVLGLYLLVQALETTGMLGVRGSLVAEQLPYLGLYIFVGHWLGLRLFSHPSSDSLPVQATLEQASTMRRSASFLGLLIALAGLLLGVATYDEYPESSTAVLLFPVAVLAGLSLYRLGRILVTMSRGSPEEENISYVKRWLTFLGRIVMALGALGIALAAVGYMNAGMYLLFPTAMSLGLLAIWLLLNDQERHIYALIKGVPPSEASAALIPTLLGSALFLLGLPIFALIWGVRMATLSELWAKFREGFTVGDTRISPEVFLTFAVVFVALYLATRILQGALRNNVLPKTQIDPGGQTAIVSGLGYVGIFLAAAFAFTAAGIDLTSLAFVAGALSIGIGFGLQNIVQNFVSGIILLIERPVAEGDWIQVGEHMGTVRKISVRSTLVETFDRTDVIVPNGDFISSPVINWTRTNSIGRVKVPVGVAYGTDTRLVEAILKEIAQEHPLVTIIPEPAVDFLGFGADSLDFQIRAVLRDVNFSMSVKTEMNHRIAERFAEEGIEIPFAQRDIWLRNPETLSGSFKPPEQKSQPSNKRELHLSDDDKELDPALGDPGGDGEMT